MKAISADGMKRATRRQLLLSGIQQEVTSAQKQIALLSQAIGDSAAGGGASPSDVALFKSHLDEIAAQIHELEQLADPDIRPRISNLAAGFRDLSASWAVFYENFGFHTSTAIKELAIRGEPLSQHVIQQVLPELEAVDRVREAAVAHSFFDDSEMIQRINLRFSLSRPSSPCWLEGSFSVIS